MAEPPCFHFRGHGFDPWLGKVYILFRVAKKKKKETKILRKEKAFGKVITIYI